VAEDELKTYVFDGKQNDWVTDRRTPEERLFDFINEIHETLLDSNTAVEIVDMVIRGVSGPLPVICPECRIALLESGCLSCGRNITP